MSQILVTPKPLNNPVLSTKAAMNVLNRQLTMQLMPMYRVRQRSAGLKPMVHNSNNSNPILTVAKDDYNSSFNKSMPSSSSKKAVHLRPPTTTHNAIAEQLSSQSASGSQPTTKGEKRNSTSV